VLLFLEQIALLQPSNHFREQQIAFCSLGPAVLHTGQRPVWVPAFHDRLPSDKNANKALTISTTVLHGLHNERLKFIRWQRLSLLDFRSQDHDLGSFLAREVISMTEMCTETHNR
jgi:hypothetical protein